MYTKGGDTVLDPFCGSAVCGAAALKLGRNYFGINPLVAQEHEKFEPPLVRQDGCGGIVGFGGDGPVYPIPFDGESEEPRATFALAREDLR